MARYIEYETDTGRIISELTSQMTPAPTENISYLEIPDDQLIDLTGYKVKNGSLVKDYETNEERLERERGKREQAARVRARLKNMGYEFVIAMLDDNDSEIKDLKAEFKRLKVYL